MVISIVFALLFLLVNLLVRTRLLTPILAITENANTVCQGEFDATIVGTGTPRRSGTIGKRHRAHAAQPQGGYASIAEAIGMGGPFGCFDS